MEPETRMYWDEPVRIGKSTGHFHQLEYYPKPDALNDFQLSINSVINDCSKDIKGIVNLLGGAAKLFVQLHLRYEVEMGGKKLGEFSKCLSSITVCSVQRDSSTGIYTIPHRETLQRITEQIVKDNGKMILTYSFSKVAGIDYLLIKAAEVTPILLRRPRDLPTQLEVI
jgi:hypothetical protein